MLKKSTAALMLALVAAAALTVRADDDGKSKISVSGKAEKILKPEIAEISIYLSADAILMTDAEKNYQEKYAKLEKALKEKFKDLTITQKVLSIGQKRNNNYNPCNKPAPQPEIRKQITITAAPDPATVTQIIDIAIRNGATLRRDPQVYYSGQINSVALYGLKECSDAEQQLEAQALADMKKNAEKLAALTGRKLGKIASLSMSVSGIPGKISRYSPFPKTELKYYAVTPDEIKVKATAKGSYYLED